MKKPSEWHRRYDLEKARQHGPRRQPAAHQQRALAALNDWYDTPADPHAGMLVLPTGAGKTFTAIHFLCRRALSEGRKLLWVAHTHHLLEQAFKGFEHGVGLVAEPRATLNARVVSGTTGHFRIASVTPEDDVVVCSVQTASRALEDDHPALEAFLSAADGRLMVVFDEAHHVPAPTYRRFITSLQKRQSRMTLLGLTATPTYTDERKRGWLKRIFAAGIVHQEEPQRLMADGTLAIPIPENAPTDFEPDFDDRAYRNWVNTYRDLPEKMIEELAQSRERNLAIASYYVEHKARLGKTIMFADRWYQCEQIGAFLEQRGVRADAIYSHVDRSGRTAEVRNRRTADYNAKVLQRFRNDELDVLLNVRMLTEGTDVPSVRSVFLTRQTTSQILLTQMIGRALRGPNFKGTDTAYVVSFIDNWRQHINWASYDPLTTGPADADVVKRGTRPPTMLISISLVRALARQMDGGRNINPAPYATMLPAGWYRVEYEARVADPDSDDIEHVERLVMVYDDHAPRLARLIEELQAAMPLSDLEAFDVAPETLDAFTDQWATRVFDALNDLEPSTRSAIVDIARHIAQNEGEAPPFFPFAEREHHDLDRVAKELLERGLSRLEEEKTMRGEYVRSDRFWRSLYPTYSHFKSHYNGSVERILYEAEHGTTDLGSQKTYENTEVIQDREPSEETKKEVKARDGNKCLCCGVTRRLQIDHISPHHLGGHNHEDNLQTLCGPCNRLKATDNINFRVRRTALEVAPPELPDLAFTIPGGNKAGDREAWARYLKQVINFYYRCSAVESVDIGGRGPRFWRWKVDLYQGNDPSWLEPHLELLAEEARESREYENLQGPEAIEVCV